MLDLAKLLIDSLNEESIGASLTGTGAKDEKGIGKLERLLIQRQYLQVERDMRHLRTLQGVRSRGAAHRRGSDYDLAKAGLDPHDFYASVKVLFQRSVEMLRSLSKYAETWPR